MIALVISNFKIVFTIIFRKTGDFMRENDIA